MWLNRISGINAPVSLSAQAVEKVYVCTS
jgi:hypothetical protein